MNHRKTFFLATYFRIFILAAFAVFFALNGSAQESTLSERFAQIEKMEGDVQAKVSADANWAIAEKGMRILQGGEIRTGGDALAIISIDEDGSAGKLDIYANTWVRVATLAYSEKEQAKLTLFDLALGQILATAKDLAEGGAFQVRTPTSTSSVRGSEAVFEVKVEEK